MTDDVNERDLFGNDPPPRTLGEWLIILGLTLITGGTAVLAIIGAAYTFIIITS